jgi:hypothetical protein
MASAVVMIVLIVLLLPAHSALRTLPCIAYYGLPALPREELVTHSGRLRQQARRGWVVLTDATYLVRGPDGERQVCRLRPSPA